MSPPSAKHPSGNRSLRLLRSIERSGLAIPAGIALLWWYGSNAGWWDPYLLPGPCAVMTSLLETARSGELVTNIAASVARIAKGFSLATIFALSLSFLCGLRESVARQLAPSLEFLRHIPPMATIPMLILWLGIGEASKIAIIVLATFFPVFLNTVEGISRYDEGLVDVARCFGYTPTQTLRRVVIPGAIPYILTGMRLGLGYGWRSLIASELLAASSGLGYMILNAEQLSRPDIVMAGILVIGFLGSAVDMLFSLLSDRIMAYGKTNGVA